MKISVPYGITNVDQVGLNYFAAEISWGSDWVNLNDRDRFQISADQSLDASQRSWRKITATSPVFGGNYLVHAVPDMVTENVGVWIRGSSQSEMNDNYALLQELFEQFDFRMRWTFNEYREYWRCQLADSSTSRGQVWAHNQMAQTTFSVPRYPNVVRERIG